MDKNNKKGTIKEILNKENVKESFSDTPNENDTFSQSRNLASKENEKESDTTYDFTATGESAKVDQYSDFTRNSGPDRTSNNSNNYFIDIAVLNEISKACQLAMSNIAYLSSRISNKDMKKDLVAIYSQYANILLQVDQHFEKYGEIPENVPNSLKTMGIYGIKINTKFDRSNSKIAEIMIQGENMGIIKSQKILNNNLDIQKSTCDLLKKFRGFQKENIAKLNIYL